MTGCKARAQGAPNQASSTPVARFRRQGCADMNPSPIFASSGDSCDSCTNNTPMAHHGCNNTACHQARARTLPIVATSTHTIVGFPDIIAICRVRLSNMSLLVTLQKEDVQKRHTPREHNKDAFPISGRLTLYIAMAL